MINVKLHNQILFIGASFFRRCWCSQKFAIIKFDVKISFVQTFGSPTANTLCLLVTLASLWNTNKGINDKFIVGKLQNIIVLSGLRL